MGHLLLIHLLPAGHYAQGFGVTGMEIVDAALARGLEPASEQ